MEDDSGFWLVSLMGAGTLYGSRHVGQDCGDCLLCTVFCAKHFHESSALILPAVA